jgi:hypothetical protein
MRDDMMEKVIEYITVIDKVVWAYFSEKYHKHIKPELRWRVRDMMMHPHQLQEEIGENDK